METRTFKTDLTCGNCVAEIKPLLDAEPSIASWSAAPGEPGNPLTVTGARVDADLVGAVLARGGYRIAPEGESWLATYYPLLLILAYLILGVSLLESFSGEFAPMRAMTRFMGGFFLVFSFFKLLDLKGFADAYQTYDVIARRSRAYAFAYPFIELVLGIAYLSGARPVATSAITLVVMGVSSVGVIQALLRRSAIQCACLGTVFKLPMTQVTLVEDLAMAIMAAAGLAAYLS